jgi:excisionase family DNA binding protein
MTEKFVTPKVASEVLGVSTETLKNWEKEGKIKSVKTEGGHRRYLMADISRLTRNQETNFYVFEHNNCLIFVPKSLGDLAKKKYMREATLDVDWVDLYLPEDGKIPTPLLCVSVDNPDYYKVVKYPREINTDFYLPIQLKWKSVQTLADLEEFL